MVSELSILIPVYNYNVTALVKTLHWQCLTLLISFEIRLYDDGSAADIQKQNTIGIQNLTHTCYLILPYHLGRAAIRNKLAKDAVYPYILFLDNDCEIINPDYIRNYLQALNGEEILVGGTSYSEVEPPTAYKLHWKYGRQREQRTAAHRNKFPYNSFHLNNVLLNKAIIQQFPLQELHYGYGHEDTIFGKHLQQAGFKVRHIDNQVIHAGLEESAVYLHKTKEAAFNLNWLYRKKLVGNEVKLVRLYNFLTKTRSLFLFEMAYNKIEKILIKQLLSAKPNLNLLDLYKLHYFSSAVNKD